MCYSEEAAQATRAHGGRVERPLTPPKDRLTRRSQSSKSWKLWSVRMPPQLDSKQGPVSIAASDVQERVGCRQAVRTIRDVIAQDDSVGAIYVIGNHLAPDTLPPDVPKLDRNLHL
eukprot:scaffold311729_cov24-Tisochrysis_lutea.AAC.1